MKSEFQPLLSAKADITKLKDNVFPLVASPKLDGIRALVYDGKLVSRRLKAIPNTYIRECLQYLPDGLDGEIITYTDGGMDDFNTIQSKVMRGEGETDFEFFVFDDFSDPALPYRERVENLRAWCAGTNHGYVRFVPITTVTDRDSLEYLFRKHIGEGWEGTMIRKPNGPYKYGRATLREGTLSKLKVLDDSEGRIVGFEEQQENTNTLEKDERGYAKRSSAKAGKVGKDTLGAILFEWQGLICRVYSGMNDELRKEIWENREVYQGQLITFQYEGVGPNGKPRFPRFKGIRDPRDT